MSNNERFKNLDPTLKQKAQKELDRLCKEHG